MYSSIRYENIILTHCTKCDIVSEFTRFRIMDSFSDKKSNILLVNDLYTMFIFYYLNQSLSKLFLLEP